MTTKVQAEFLAAGIISDQSQVSAASADHVLIFDASDNSLKKALVSTIASGATALDDIGTGDAASTLATSSGDIILDSPDSIVLDADGDGSISFKDGGTRYALIEKSSDNVVIRADLSDGDILFQGKDNTSTITAFTLDMSDAGRALFNGSIDIGGTSITKTGDLTLDVSGDITLDAGGDNIKFHDSGTEVGQIDLGSQNLTFRSSISDKDMIFRVNDGGSEIVAMTIDASEAANIKVESGNVLMETAGNYVQVAGSSSTYWAIGSSGGSNPPGTASTSLAFHHWDGSAWNNEVEFSSAGNITADGNLVLGGTATFKFINSTWISSADGVNRLYYTANGTSYYKTADDHQFRNSSDATKVSFDSSGNGVFAGNVTAYGSPSDIVLKENVEVIDNAMNKVNQLKGITYDLKSDGNRLTGLVAQDLEKVLPEAVYTAEDLDGKEHLAIRYGNTVGLLVEAIKELSAKIEKLEGK